MNTMYMEDIAILVVEAAQEIFERCGAKSDFCVQSVGSGCAVFGGTNRVIFNPLSGFKADAGHCTARFLAAFDAHCQVAEMMALFKIVRNK